MVGFLLRALEKLAWVLGILAAWEIALLFLDIPAYVLPSPLLIFHRLALQMEYLLTGLWATTWKAAAGASLALGLAFIAVLASDFAPRTRLAVLTVSGALESVPKIVLAPVFVVWLGIGAPPKIILAALVCFFPAFQRLDAGWQSVPRELVDYGAALGATRRTITFEIRCPWVIPDLWEAGRLCVPLSFVGVIIGEFISSREGVGPVMMLALGQMDMATVFAAGALVALVAGGGVYLCSWCLDRSLAYRRHASY